MTTAKRPYKAPERPLAYLDRRVDKKRARDRRYRSKEAALNVALARTVQEMAEVDPLSVPHALAKVQIEEWAHLPRNTQTLLMLVSLEGTNRGVAARLGISETEVYRMFSEVPDGGYYYKQARAFRMRIVREMAEINMVKGIAHYHDMIEHDNAKKPSLVVQKAIHDLAEMTGAIQRHGAVAVGVSSTITINTPWKDEPPTVEVTAKETTTDNPGGGGHSSEGAE